MEQLAPRSLDVLFIGGAPRSGTTLLDLLLGALPGFFSGGELMFLWERGVRDNQLCGCGQPFQDCPFWSEVGEHAFGGWKNVDLEKILQLRQNVDRHWNFLSLAAGLPRRRRLELTKLTDVLTQLYSSIRAVSSCEVIIDSSKRPAYAQILRRTPAIRLRMVHCVRDPRAAGFSHSRHVQRPEITNRVELMPRYGALRAAILWMASNFLIQLVQVPRTRLRYEELIRAPDHALRRLLSELERSDSDELMRVASGAGSAGAVVLPTNHTVAGNPVRFTRGPLLLREDDEWRTNQGKEDELLTLLLTWPVMLAYGYLRPPTTEPKAD
jgi:Sulfotransferase family